MRTRLVTGLAAAVALAMLPAERADAFCGFYINGAGGEMFNNATEVVLMRSGTRTVLSMQNNYQGPAQDFAMVIPVPVVLHEGDVKTLPKEVFTKVDTMGSPRLVEYWEQDPCPVPEADDDKPVHHARRADMGSPEPKKKAKEAEDFGVTIEAKFEVGEYQIAILSAKDSTGLDGYLRSANYQIPKGAEPLLRPYVEGGSKFFVAKVDPKKVAFENGQVKLSPLRFHYDSEEFSLPIRLGLANSNGTQDLIVNIVAPKQRYELANYKNVTIPTNFDVVDDVRTRFGEFYASLFDRTVHENPGAIVTEYSWDAGTCDPCPGPRLDERDFLTLGADVLPTAKDDDEDNRPRRRGRGRRSGQYVLTRLHARYGKDGVPNDLVFKTADPIFGGREQRDASGQLEHGAQRSEVNNFQARYAIRHEWTGPIACANPIRGRWGGPPRGSEIARPMTQGATDLAFQPRGKVQLPQLVMADIPEIHVQKGVDLPIETPPATTAAPVTAGGTPFVANTSRRADGCACQSSDPGAGALGVAGLVGLVALRRKRRARR